MKPETKTFSPKDFEKAHTAGDFNIGLSCTEWAINMVSELYNNGSVGFIDNLVIHLSWDYDVKSCKVFVMKNKGTADEKGNYYHDTLHTIYLHDGYTLYEKNVKGDSNMELAYKAYVCMNKLAKELGIVDYWKAVRALNSVM
jgi:hypothetical protein